MNKLGWTLILCVLFLLVSCNNATKSTQEGEPVKNAFVEGLVEKKILEDRYVISIPADYSVNELNGADFVVYYLYPTDTTLQPDFAGGIYFGNHPNLFEYAIDSSKITIVKNEIHGENAAWTIYNGDTLYSTQTIIESRNGEYWCEYIHVFGNARAALDLEKLFAIFSTFSLNGNYFMNLELSRSIPELGPPLNMKEFTMNAVSQSGGFRGELLNYFPATESISIKEITWDASLPKEAGNKGYNRLTIRYARMKDKSKSRDTGYHKLPLIWNIETSDTLLWLPIHYQKWHSDSEF